MKRRPHTTHCLKHNISRKSWDSLTSSLQETRKRSLQVLSRMRQGATLSTAAKDIGIGSRTVLKHLGNTLVKRRGKYLAKPTDRISRGLVINSKGKQVEVTVKDSKSASIIGEYHNAVKQYLESGDDNVLKKFRRISIVDNQGKRHRLETDGENLRAIESTKEDRELHEGIYQDR